MWRDIAKKFQDARASAIPEKWRLPDDVLRSAPENVTGIPAQFLTARELELTDKTASELAGLIRTRSATSLEITEAVCHRAAIAHQLTNCLTEIFFEDGLAQARELDRVLSESGRPVGPLHGVPISVKDHWNVQGQYTTAGYIANARFPRKDEDAHVVAILKGAEYHEALTYPLNPYNTKLGAGGSSGGEGALVAMRGSPMGLGSDIGGSIRVPAAFNGLYGFKPSGKRIVPTSGWECTMLGSESITAVGGPLARSVEDLDLFFRTVSDASPWLREPMHNMPWRPDGADADTKLRIGVMYSDEVVTPHPPIQEALRIANERLTHGGHDVIQFHPYDHRRAWDDILLPLYFTDGGADIRNTLETGHDEPMFPSAKRLLDDPIVKTQSIHELWKLHLARDTYKTEYLAHWNATAKQTRSKEPIDVLICAASSVQGTQHDVKPWWGYCSQWNLLDYPCGIIPVRNVPKNDAYPAGYKPLNDLDEENVKLFSPTRYADMPVTLQVVGRTQQDEKVMAAMKIIDKVLNG